MFFRLKIDTKDYDKEKDLIVKVFSEGQYQGDPDVYISRVRSYFKDLKYAIEQ